ncbi:MAG: cupin domain-containing protein [Planctomycetes bacterium]|nr:cupin domain-containing protein [Planctomycetota bacterium]
MSAPSNTSTSCRVYSVVGDRYHFLVTGEESNGAFAMIDAYVPPLHGPPLHVHHNEDEVFHVLEGEFTFTVAGLTMLVKAGQTIFGKRNVPHTFKNTGSTTGRMILLLSPAGLEKFFAEVGTPLASPQAAAIEPTPSDIKRLMEAARRYGLEIRA